MNKNEILPLGTVVLLKGATKKLMISGYYPIDNGSKKMYDYAACMYPIGYLNAATMIVFNSDAIEKVFFKGYQNEEYNQFIEELDKIDINDLVKQNLKREEDFTYIDNKK